MMYPWVGVILVGAVALLFSASGGITRCRGCGGFNAAAWDGVRADLDCSSVSKGNPASRLV